MCFTTTFKDVWQSILWKLGPEYNMLKMTDDELQEKLVQVLETQNTLIVLNDIWREEDWDIIKPNFPRESVTFYRTFCVIIRSMPRVTVGYYSP